MGVVMSAAKGVMTFKGTKISTGISYGIDESSSGEAVTPANTRGAEIVSSGTRDWSASASGKGHTPQFWPGESGAIELYTGKATPGDTWSGDAFLNSIAITSPNAAGNYFGWSAAFLGDGVLSAGVESVLTQDVSNPTDHSARASMTVLIGGVEYTHVDNWNLNISAGFDTYSVDHDDNWQGRIDTGLRQVSGSITMVEAHGVNLPRGGVIAELLLNVNTAGTEFYRVKYAKLTARSHPIDVGGRGKMMQTLSFTHTLASAASAAYDGTVVAPDGTVII